MSMKFQNAIAGILFGMACVNDPAIAADDTQMFTFLGFEIDAADADEGNLDHLETGTPGPVVISIKSGLKPKARSSTGIRRR